MLALYIRIFFTYCNKIVKRGEIPGSSYVDCKNKSYTQVLNEGGLEDSGEGMVKRPSRKQKIITTLLSTEREEKNLFVLTAPPLSSISSIFL